MFSFENDTLKRVIKKLKPLLGDNLIAVVAFGSRVRGDFNEESDFDILVVVKKRTFGIIDKINSILEHEEDKTGIPFSAVVKGIDVFDKEKKYKTTFYRNIKKDGIVLYGRA